MLLLVDSGLDDLGVESIWDQGDDQVDLGNLCLKSLRVGDIDRDGIGVLEAFTELLGAVQSPASYEGSVSLDLDRMEYLHTDSDQHIGLVKLNGSWSRDEARTEEQYLPIADRQHEAIGVE